MLTTPLVATALVVPVLTVSKLPEVRAVEVEEILRPMPVAKRLPEIDAIVPAVVAGALTLSRPPVPV